MATTATTARTALLAVLALLVSPLLVVVGTSPAHAAVSVFPVPTSNAGLGRIVTAPDGSMWFAMSDANKVGRITTSGQIQEFPLPPTDSSVDGPVQDLDVSPDGSVWVATEHGSNLVRMSSAGQLLANWTFPNYDGCAGDTCPYADAVRVGRDGVAWVTMNFGSSFIVKVTPGGQLIDPANAPACDDVLGEAADGTMWCQGGASGGQDTIVRVNADAAGGTTYPLPSDATYPNALAAGPVGSIWFTRSSSGTMFTSPSNGSIGYLDAASGVTQIWDTGSRTAPQDLVMGPDGRMWFANVGAVPGIGHISANGDGAISSVGNHEPHSLAFGPDGAIWFTDPKSNSIVRVTTDQLGTTNVDLGDGVTMLPSHATRATLPVGTLRKVKGVRKLEDGVLRVPLSCPRGVNGCAGTIRVELASGKKAISRPRSYAAVAGGRATVPFKIHGKALRKIRPGQVVKVRVELTAPGSKKVLVKRTIKVRRA